MVQHPSQTLNVTSSALVTSTSSVARVTAYRSTFATVPSHLPLPLTQALFYLLAGLLKDVGSTALSVVFSLFNVLILKPRPLRTVSTRVRLMASRLPDWSIAPSVSVTMRYKTVVNWRLLRRIATCRVVEIRHRFVVLGIDSRCSRWALR